MNKKTRFLAQAGMIAALYVVVTHLQNFVWPESTSFAIQFRLSEALCVLSVMTPAAIPGLTIGCLVYNLTYIGALPLDWLMGSAATLLTLDDTSIERISVSTTSPLRHASGRPVEAFSAKLTLTRPSFMACSRPATFTSPSPLKSPDRRAKRVTQRYIAPVST